MFAFIPIQTACPCAVDWSYYGKFTFMPHLLSRFFPQSTFRPTQTQTQTRPAFQVNKLIEIHVRFIPALLYFFPVTLFVLNSGKTEQIARVRSPKNQVLLDRLTSQPTFLIRWYRSSVCRREKFLYAVFQFSFLFMLCVTPALIDQMTCYKITRKLQYCTTPFFFRCTFFLVTIVIVIKV